MSNSIIRPIIQQDKLTCPVCGQQGMPMNRKCCWKCGVPFGEPTTEMPDNIPKCNPRSTESGRAAMNLRETELVFAKQERRIVPEYNKESVKILSVFNLIFVLISCIFSFCKCQ